MVASEGRAVGVQGALALVPGSGPPGVCAACPWLGQSCPFPVGNSWLQARGHLTP